ncbi:uncharacterized protein EDB91DRAFT_1130966, partial [Suillus paluster]|uniref:uncharacterized protein n=1 Tax=Suillus paluster TaxID=48578 RepID=UPI001B87D976
MVVCLGKAYTHQASRPSYFELVRLKAGSAFRDLLVRSPVELTTYFDHCRGLKFEDKPNYAMLRQLFGQIMDREGYTRDTRFDWVDGSSQNGIHWCLRTITGTSDSQREMCPCYSTWNLTFIDRKVL